MKKILISFFTFISKTWVTILLVCAAAVISLQVGYVRGYNTSKTEKPMITGVVNECTGLSSWDVYILATVMTESNFNQYAKGKTSDIGILQITPIFVKDVNRILGYTAYNIDDAYDIEKSIEMFHIIQDHYNSEHDVDKAMHLHNPGGQTIDYFNKVYDNMSMVMKYEAVRKELVKYFIKSRNFSERTDTIYVKDTSIHGIEMLSDIENKL